VIASNRPFEANHREEENSMVARAIFVLLSALAGMALFLRAQDPSREFLLLGLGMGAVAGGLILAGEYALRRLSFGIIVGAAGAVGAVGAVGAAGTAGEIAGWLVNPPFGTAAVSREAG